MVHHYMEDQPERERDGPTVKFTVLPHPEAEAAKTLVDMNVEPKTSVDIADEPFEPPPPACCPMPGMDAHTFTFPEPSVSIDVRDLSATLLGTFVAGAAVAFAIAYFSKQKPSCNA